MCGIAGFIGDYPKPLLHAMNQSLAHRGPDDYGELFDAENRLGLSHRRLSIIDLSPRGRQPMWDETGQVAIVFNGEIFNYRECRKRLEGSGHAFKSDSDTEVILNLYLRYGEGIFSRLNGMYAFAIDTVVHEKIDKYHPSPLTLIASQFFVIVVFFVLLLL